MAKQIKDVDLIWHKEPGRIALFERLMEMGISQRQLSIHLGASPGHINSYLFRGGHLSKEERGKIAKMLNMDEKQLLNSPSEEDLVPRSQAKRARLDPMPETDHTPNGHVPLFILNTMFNIDTAATVTTLEFSPRPDFAVWISGTHGRLREGDIAFVSLEAPARHGDMVVVISGRRLTSIGTVDESDIDAVQTQAGTIKVCDDHQIAKIIWVKYS